MVRLALLTLVAGFLGGVARADSCPPSVLLEGDAALVAAIAGDLLARGITTSAAGDCSPVRARVERRGHEIVIVVVEHTGSSTERVVTETATAATVIESFTRGDMALPLLATRTITAPSRAAPPYEDATLQRTPSPSIQLAAALESSLANDGTTWVGGNLKLCIRVGPICATARFRKSRVIDGLAAAERDLAELLVGVDIPIPLGPVVLVPGFAGGFGGMDTYLAGMRRETGAFRGETHVALWVPLVFNLALEASLGAGLGQQTDFDRSGLMVPPEPWGALRAGIGLRYGTQ